MITKSCLLLVAVSVIALLGPISAENRKPDECGLASVYATTREETASGEDTRPEDFTAAHRTLPFGTLLNVNNQDNGRTAAVRITDRGPFVSGRIVDVSQVAARELGITGLARVCLDIVWTPPDKKSAGAK